MNLYLFHNLYLFSIDSFQIVVQATRGRSHISDIAVDDFSFYKCTNGELLLYVASLEMWDMVLWWLFGPFTECFTFLLIRDLEKNTDMPHVTDNLLSSTYA